MISHAELSVSSWLGVHPRPLNAKRNGLRSQIPDFLPTIAMADQEKRARPTAGKNLCRGLISMCLDGRRGMSNVQACCSTEVADENHVVVFVSDFTDDSSGEGMGFYENTACTGHHAAYGIDS